MAFEKSFTEDFARELIRISPKHIREGLDNTDIQELIDVKIDVLKSRVTALTVAQKKMAQGYQMVLSALKEAYPTLDLEDPNIQGTPERMARALIEICAGLGIEEPKIFDKYFPSGNYNEMIMLKNIEFTSLCAHHFFPFTGKAHIGYLPSHHTDGDHDPIHELTSESSHRVVGLSKLARIVDVYANRPQLQEKMCVEIMESIKKYLDPAGIMVVIEGKHQCLSCRGAKKTEATMITSALDGVFKSSAKLRSEFLSLLSKNN